MKIGDRVKFTGNVSKEQIRWGGHKDPNDVLIPGNIYTVSHVDVHSWHTRIYLDEAPGQFNSVWFVKINFDDEKTESKL